MTLRIFANSSSSAGFNVKKVTDNSWQEKSITYNAAPAPGDQVGTSNKVASNDWVSIDVTPLLHGNGTFSIALVGIDFDRNQPGSSRRYKPCGSAAGRDCCTCNLNADPHFATQRNSDQDGCPNNHIHDPPHLTGTQPNPTATQPNPTATQAGDIQPGFPIRAMFFYPWFPEAWNQQGFNPFTNYTPSLGFYDSSSLSIIRSQINSMTYGNISAAIFFGGGRFQD